MQTYEISNRMTKDHIATWQELQLSYDVNIYIRAWLLFYWQVSRNSGEAIEHKMSVQCRSTKHIPSHSKKNVKVFSSPDQESTVPIYK